MSKPFTVQFGRKSSSYPKGTQQKTVRGKREDPSPRGWYYDITILTQRLSHYKKHAFFCNDIASVPKQLNHTYSTPREGIYPLNPHGPLNPSWMFIAPQDSNLSLLPYKQQQL